MKTTFIASKNHSAKYELHIAKEVRKKYNFEDEFFSITGRIIFANFAAVRKFVHLVNTHRSDDQKLSPGEINSLGLLEEIYHFVLREYEQKQNPGVFKRALKTLYDHFGEIKTQDILFEFVSVFPPTDVYKGKLSTLEYLQNYAGEKSNYEITLEELLLFYLSNFNPAAEKVKELIDDSYLTKKEDYLQLMTETEKFFQNEEPIGKSGKDVFSFLKTPILMNPRDLYAQLGYVKDHWGIMLSPDFMNKILSGFDFAKETYLTEESFGGKPPTPVPAYKGKIAFADNFVLGKSAFNYAEDINEVYDEPERFTADIDWMPSVVLLAKNTYVWLDQLSKKYGRSITKLDQIPDEELDLLSRWGFTGLWLIGIWERSRASKRIKHIMGNIDAVASAYSLYDYEIAHDLGGEAAYNNLNQRAKQRGIRLASDMVPNHTGIYSKWVIEKPDYFIQSEFPPFPNYSFTGENLSEHPDFDIRIEDGYWRRSDAAVVFRYIDNRTGKARFIYHGNDGTNMPWNDTAQLDMLKREVREAVIQKIMDVARRFSIIRFDAAMTLTKRHFSRLWYPQPGKGGDIPSRADFALTKKQFDDLFPEEFWREVVDRINNEMPETLLLAEAFWLMEGYFVRSLGMHRVYNSAFMHMMMNEENEKYRDLITNTLEFEPEILKRYVNFMSNPDEETAINQFGADDKYFGVSSLMVTLPGLPMFAHGQVEGYNEKYGMEYKRAYYNEQPNQWLIEKHEKLIFPLIKKRFLFSQVENFYFYDFIDQFGNINENVFAYSNFARGERALIFFNNRYEIAKGKIKFSTPKLDSMNKNRTYNLSLSEAIKIKSEWNYFYVYKEHVSGLEFLVEGSSIDSNGFYTELKGFQTMVLLDFREVYDTSGKYRNLYNRLNGSGVVSIERTLLELEFEPIHNSFEEILTSVKVKKLMHYLMNSNYIDDCSVQFSNRFEAFLNVLENELTIKSNTRTGLRYLSERLLKTCGLTYLLNSRIIKPKTEEQINIFRRLKLSEKSNYRTNYLIYFVHLLLNAVDKSLSENEKINKNNFIEELLLEIPVRKILQRLGRESDLYFEFALLNVLMKFENLIENYSEEKHSAQEDQEMLKTKNLIVDLLEDDYVKALLDVNYYDEVWYFSKEKFEDLIEWLLTVHLTSMLEVSIETGSEVNSQSEKKVEQSKHESIEEKSKIGLTEQKLKIENLSAVKEVLKDYEEIIRLSINSKYNLEMLVEMIKKSISESGKGKV
ncbi:MAG: alpha-amylase family glycosyl hydrolase [Melioribacteraceae bacterium]|nr:alpha-amylase family glycosyl hydrolase [Melioribacteraceae bacterium]